MRRSAFIVTVCMMALPAAALLPGCGGDSGKAKQYIKDGDGLISSVEETGAELGTAIEEAFTQLFDHISQGKAPDASAFSEQSARLSSLAEQMLGEATAAKAAYGKVEQLDDVPDYAEYAALLNKLIDINVEGLNQLNSFLEQAEARLVSTPFDAVAFQVFVTEFGESMKKVGEEGGVVQKEARELRKKKGF